MEDYIGISEDRLHHILGVARKAYKIAKEEGFDEDFARKMFMIGWLHDIGYEFSKEPDNHAEESANLLLGILDAIYIKEDVVRAILEHGHIKRRKTDEWRILNMADMQVNSKGEEVTFDERLKDIKERYGEDSEPYKNSCDLCYIIGEMLEEKQLDND